MLIKTRGIIFRTKKYSETSVIADIYTEAKGLRSYLVSGVRTKKAKVNASLMQVLSLVDLVVYHRDDKDLTRIKEIKAAHVFTSIPFVIQKGAVGLFMAEIARKTIRESEQNIPLFNFLYDTILHLDAFEESIANAHLYFMVHLCSFLGFMPSGQIEEGTPYFDLEEGCFYENQPLHAKFLNEQLSALLSQLLQMPRNNIHTLKMDRQQRKELLSGLLDFYGIHIENFPTIHAHEVLEVVLA